MVRVTEEERAMADELAQADGLTAADLVRQLIRRYFAERQPKKR